MNKDRFDPEVYEFYKPALEGAGFAAPFTVADIPALREDEVIRHAANTKPYEIAEKYDELISRSSAEPLPVRIYVPESVRNSDHPAPMILYFHGGGWVMGSVEDHDPLCGKLADACSSVVISVEYRLAPEYPFPAAIEDAVSAAEWEKENAARFGGDPTRLMAGGDSSGANIAATLALLGRDGKAPEISGLILFYGAFGCLSLEESASALEYGQGGFVLPLSSMREMIKIYVPEGTDPTDTRLNPGQAEDLSGMPDTFLVTAEFDPLRDDGETFAMRLKDAGCRVTLTRMEGMMHGFILYWQHFRRAEELLDRIGGWVQAR